MKMSMKTFALTVVLCLAATFSLQAEDKKTSEGKYAVFLKLWDAAGMDQQIQGQGKLTILIPTNEAFKELNGLAPRFLEDLQKPENAKRLKRIMMYHVLLGEHDLTLTTEEKTYKTLQGGDVIVKDKQGRLMVNDAQVVLPNIEFNIGGHEGMVDVISRVLIPPPIPQEELE